LDLPAGRQGLEIGDSCLMAGMIPRF